MWLAFKRQRWQHKYNSKWLPLWVTGALFRHVELFFPINCSDHCLICEKEPPVHGVHYVIFTVDQTLNTTCIVRQAKHLAPSAKESKWTYLYCPNIDHEKVFAFVKGQLGKPFDANNYNRVIHFGWMFPFTRCIGGAAFSWDDTKLALRPKWMCFELVTAALLIGGWRDRLKGCDPCMMHPARLYDYLVRNTDVVQQDTPMLPSRYKDGPRLIHQHKRERKDQTR